MMRYTAIDVNRYRAVSWHPAVGCRMKITSASGTSSTGCSAAGLGVVPRHVSFLAESN